MNIVLIGYRGTGKSAVGTLLAQRLGRPYLAMDALLVERAGISIPEIVAREGWPGFRDRESALARELAALDNVVIDCGGGIIERPENIDVLRANGCLIWLRAEVPTIVARIQDDTQRPSLTDGKSFTDEVAEVLTRRTPSYAAAAHHAIATDDLTPEVIAERILALVAEAPVSFALLATFRAEIAALLPEIIAFRQARHREPELACVEYKTRAAIAEALQGENLQIREPLIGTDLIAEFGQGDRLILLRADIDGVATTEQSDLPYRSIHDGVMHACGHDGHTAMLLGAAKVLARHQDRLPHRVRCVFQPGEEIRAAGRDLVQAGACDGADEAYAIHDWPGYPAGAVVCREGAILAAAAFFTITITGRGCHGAEPHRGNNPIPLAAELITRLHAAHQRLQAAGDGLISVCAVSAGTVGNVIPDQAVLRGTTRYLRPDMADTMAAIIQEACDAITEGSEATVALDYARNYEIPVLNTPAGYANVRRMAETAFGTAAFVEMPAPSMGGEDFAYYLPGREGALLLLGQGEASQNLHANTFDFNDDTLAAGILMYCLLASGACIARNDVNSTT